MVSWEAVRWGEAALPELPEVETVCRGLAMKLEGKVLTRVEQRRKDLRFPLPVEFAQRLTGRRIVRITPARQIHDLGAGRRNGGDRPSRHVGAHGAGPRLAGGAGAARPSDLPGRGRLVPALQRRAPLRDDGSAPAGRARRAQAAEGPGAGAARQRLQRPVARRLAQGQEDQHQGRAAGPESGGRTSATSMCRRRCSAPASRPSALPTRCKAIARKSWPPPSRRC